MALFISGSLNFDAAVLAQVMLSVLAVQKVTFQEMIDKIQDIVLNDRRLKVREINETVNISLGRVWHILHECLGMFQRNSKEFLRRSVIETWINYYTSETKNQSKMSTEPKKAKTVPSAGKVMATIFWESHGIILIDCLQKGKIITGEYYASLLDRFDAILKEKRSHLAKKVLFHHDNIPAHTSAIATAKLFDLRYETLSHPPYSPDLAPTDYLLFPNMKTWLRGKRFSSNEEIIAATNEYFKEFYKNYFLEGIKKLECRYNKCIQLKGDYFEK